MPWLPTSKFRLKSKGRAPGHLWYYTFTHTPLVRHHALVKTKNLTRSARAAAYSQRKSQYAKGRALGRGISLKNEVIKSPQVQELRVTDPNSPDSWAVQLFRSIDSGGRPML